MYLGSVPTVAASTARNAVGGSPTLRHPGGPRTANRVLVVPLADLAVVGLTACGGGRGSGQRAAYVQCMSQHGVTMPSRGNRPSTAPGTPRRDPSTAPPGVDQNAWTSARTACASLAPTRPADSGG